MEQLQTVGLLMWQFLFHLPKLEWLEPVDETEYAKLK